VTKPASRLGTRRHGRECAVQILYQLDAAAFAGDVDDAIATYWASGFDADETRPGDETVAFAEKLVRGVVTRLPDVDRAIQRSTQNWRLERMARVDRNILRLATWELLFGADAPPRVVLNEAIDIAKKFGTEESGAFVNGILDRVAQDAPGA
jgi:N utilization substance protein B